MQADRKPLEAYEQAFSRLFAEMAAREVRVTLVDLEKARRTDAFAKLKETMA